VRDERFRRTRRLHSDGKIELFYKSVMLVLLRTTLALAFFGSNAIEKQTTQWSVTATIECAS